MSWFFKQNKKRKNLQRGFSLLELIVVITIFLIITAVVIADIPNFRKKSTLELVSSEVATYVRGAQIYGASQKSAEGSVVYGVHFEIGSSNFYLFKDKRPDPGEKPEESYEIKGFKIGGIKINSSDYSSVDIVFNTSNYASMVGTKLEPSIYQNYTVGFSPESNVSNVDIKIEDVRDPASFKCVRIYNNGQIAVIGQSNGCQ